MRVRLLGPVDVVHDDGPRPVHGLRRKAVLAALALHPGEIVSAARLVDIVWGGSPPQAAAQTVQSHVSHLRGVLGDRSAIVARAPGYLLDLGAGGTDVRAAERLILDGGGAADPGTAAARLQAAIGLWRGPALADVAGLAWFDEPARRLRQLHRQATQDLIDARLRLGQHGEVIPQLQGLVQQDPHDEQAYAQLMLALYRAGRQGDALAAFQRLRRALDQDFGIAPGPALRELETAILRQDPAIDVAGPAAMTRSATRAAAGDVPAQLPLAPAAFTGRAGELAALDGLLTGDADEPAAVVISAVSGTAGIGKTALAVHWAHRAAARFPDGQLYVNLRGFDPAGNAVDPAEALRGFLDALGVPAERIPAGLAARGALYRSAVAGRRVLVLLDNARDADQVRPLLPGGPGGVAVVTSRSQLAGLVAVEGARPLTLGLLSHAEARDLLTRRLGGERVAAEPGPVDDIIARCARLPLALAVAAARAATQPAFPLAALATELGDAAGGLDLLRSGDPATDIRAVFSWSQQTLSPGAAELFRHLALHPGPDLTAGAAASLAGAAPHRARQLLAELTRAHLITEHTPGRYTYHDLLRAYATEQAHSHDSDEARRGAQDRTLDHYLHTAHAAALLLHPMREPIALAPARPGVTPEPLTDQDAALAWFTAEHAVLLAAVEQAAATGRDTHTWQLAWAFTTYLLRQGHWPAHLAIQDLALSAAERLGDRAGQADILHGLARTHVRLDAFADAETHFRRALDVCAGLGDAAGQAHNHMGLAEVAEQQGRPADALRHNVLATELFRGAGDRVGEANALNGIGWCHGLLGDHREALAWCMRALDLLLELDDQDGQAAAWDSLGCIHRNLGQYEQAVACHHRSVGLCREIGDRYWEADAITSLGDTHLAAGDPDAAAEAWRAALAILDELDHRKAGELRTRLAGAAAG